MTEDIFGGEEAGLSNFEQARFIVLPAPLESTVSYGGGTGAGPAAILRASHELEFFDEQSWRPYWLSGAVHTLPAVQFKTTNEQAVAAIAAAARPAVAAHKFVLTLGGEHTVTAGAVRAYAEQDSSFGMLIIDAHLDLRQQYESSEWSHACVARRILEEWNLPMAWAGIRSVAQEEAHFLDKQASPFAIAYGHELDSEPDWQQRLVDAMPGRVYLSIDIDGLDPSVAPGTGTPEPGGLLYRPLLELIERLAEQRTIIGADIVEVAPIAGQQVTEFTAAKIAAKLIGAISRKSS